MISEEIILIEVAQEENSHKFLSVLPARHEDLVS